MAHATFNQVKRYLVNDQTLSEEIQSHITDCPLCSEVKDLTAKLRFKTCEKTKEHFEALLREKMSNREQAVFMKRHIEACPHCREDYAKASIRFAFEDFCENTKAAFIGLLDNLLPSGLAVPELQPAGLRTRGGSSGLTLMGAEAGQEASSEVIVNEKYRVLTKLNPDTNQLSISISGNDVKTNVGGLTVVLLTKEGEEIKPVNEAKTDRKGDASFLLSPNLQKGEYAIAIRE